MGLLSSELTNRKENVVVGWLLYVSLLVSLESQRLVVQSLADCCGWDFDQRIPTSKCEWG